MKIRKRSSSGAENRLTDRAYVFPRLLALLEQLVGDRWLFDRDPLEEHGDSASGG